MTLLIHGPAHRGIVGPVTVNPDQPLEEVAPMAAVIIRTTKTIIGFVRANEEILDIILLQSEIRTTGNEMFGANIIHAPQVAREVTIVPSGIGSH